MISGVDGGFPSQQYEYDRYGNKCYVTTSTNLVVQLYLPVSVIRATSLKARLEAHNLARVIKFKIEFWVIFLLSEERGEGVGLGGLSCEYRKSDRSPFTQLTVKKSPDKTKIPYHYHYCTN